MIINICIKEMKFEAKINQQQHHFAEVLVLKNAQTSTPAEEPTAER